jgi:hydrogenase maturation protease
VTSRPDGGQAGAFVLVGCVSQLYQSDLDVGRRVGERLAKEDLGPGVTVEDLHYGAVAVAQLLQDVRPETLVLVGAEQRGRPPGTVERRRAELAPPSQAQQAVADAVTGYVSIDLVVDVASGLGALPPRTVSIEVEPAETGPGEELSGPVAAALDRLCERVRTEVRRAPALGLAERVHEALSDRHVEPAPAVEAMETLLRELGRLDRDGAWGATFRERDRLRLRIAAGETGEGMDHLDWGLWWALIEELDRLEKLEASGSAPL